MASASEVRYVILFLIAAYPAWTCGNPDFTLSVYERMLVDIPIDVLQAAAIRHVATSRFFPTVAELRDGALVANVGHTVADAGEAWQVVRDAMLSGLTSPDVTPEFAPLTRRTVDAMGWRELCASENQVADRAHFMQIYERLRQRQAQDDAWPVLGPALLKGLPGG